MPPFDDSSTPSTPSDSPDPWSIPPASRPPVPEGTTPTVATPVGPTPGSSYAPGSRMAPPTTAGELQVPARSSGWPTAIGVIGIVIGGLGCLGALAGMISAFTTNMAMSSVPASQDVGMDAMVEVMNRARPWTLLMSLLGLGLAIFLIVGAGRLLGRRQAGVRLLVTYAWLRLPVVLLGAGVAYWQQRNMMEAIESFQASTMPGMGVSFGFFGSTVAIAQAGFTLLWGAAWPVFLLIWFARGKVKQEVQAWA